MTAYQEKLEGWRLSLDSFLWTFFSESSCLPTGLVENCDEYHSFKLKGSGTFICKAEWISSHPWSIGQWFFHYQVPSIIPHSLFYSLIKLPWDSFWLVCTGTIVSASESHSGKFHCVSTSIITNFPDWPSNGSEPDPISLPYSPYFVPIIAFLVLQTEVHMQLIDSYLKAKKTLVQ